MFPYFFLFVKIIFAYLLYTFLKPIFLICKNKSHVRIPCIKNMFKSQSKLYISASKTYFSLLTSALGEAGPVVFTLFIVYFFVNLYMNLFTWADRAGEKVFGPAF